MPIPTNAVHLSNGTAATAQELYKASLRKHIYCNLVLIIWSWSERSPWVENSFRHYEYHHAICALSDFQVLISKTLRDMPYRSFIVICTVTFLYTASLIKLMFMVSSKNHIGF